MMSRKVSLIFLLAVVISLSFAVVSGNRGMLISSPSIYIEENAQNAIVAWNGTEEVLILSTDVKSSEVTLVLELLPLPSNPLEVKEGSFDSFTKLREVVNENLKGYYYGARGKSLVNAKALAVESGVEITFQSKIGAHNLTIVKVNNLTFFVEWANNFAEENGLGNVNFSTDFKNCVEYYLNNNINFFVFDFIELNEIQQSINPIVYRFNTSFLYYPMNITAFSDIGETFSQVHLLLLTKEILKDDVIFEIFPENLSNLKTMINLPKEELMEISPDIYALFKDNPVFTDIKYNGFLSDLKTDLTASQEDFDNPYWSFCKVGKDKVEKEILIERGKTRAVDVTVLGINTAYLSNISLSIEGGVKGLQHDWFSIKSSAGINRMKFYGSTDMEWGGLIPTNLPPGHIDLVFVPSPSTTFEVMFTIPMNIAAGEYNFSYVISSSDYELQETENATLVIYDAYDASGLSEEIDELKVEMGFLSLIVILGTIVAIIMLVVIAVIGIIFVIIKK